MSFPRYPEYKESGVDHIREIPLNWQACPIRYVTKILKGRLPTNTFEEQLDDKYLPYLSMEYLRGDQDVVASIFISHEDLIVEADAGDILVLWDGSNSGEFIKAKKGAVSSTLALIKQKGIERDFLFYALKSIEKKLQEQTIGMGIPHVSGDTLRNLKIFIPSIIEQKNIKNFLDHETAKIDALIAEQEKLIELLKEKRQAVISHAVTKGLDPNVKMKDSGVEWLGQVPEHWGVVQLKKFLDIQNGADHKLIEVEEGHPVYGSGGVFAFASDYVHDGESILLGRKGTIDKPLHVCGRFWTVDTMYWSKINTESVGKFLYYVCTTIPFNYYSTNTALPSMTKGDLGAHLIGAPVFEEQRSIANFLEHKTAKIDALIAEQTKAVSLLLERRLALISAAVTGQIDVRGLR